MPKKKKSVKQVKSKKLSVEQRLSNIERTQNKILSILTQVEKEEGDVLTMETRELNAERIVQAEEEQQLDELKKIEEIEEQIKKDTQSSPMKRITKRDIIKSVIGAFVGIVGHFAFAHVPHQAEEFTYLHSSLILLTSLIIVIMFVYFAGFRKVDDHFVMKILPIRALVIYFSAILTILTVLFLYGVVDFSSSFHHIYNTVASISILAVLGAGTADLIGKTEE